jgi:hypothetical protein
VPELDTQMIFLFLNATIDNEIIPHRKLGFSYILLDYNGLTTKDLVRGRRRQM